MPDLTSTTSLFALFSDPTRLRLMSLLWDEELTVAELTRITGLAQSRVSTHLGRLREAGLLADRKVGPSTFYRVEPKDLPPPAARTWSLLVEDLDDAILSQDRARCGEVIHARTDAAAWADLVAGRMEDHYSPGRTWEALTRGLLGLLELGEVLDVGSGDGVIAQLLAPRAVSITCLDSSPKVIEAARKRLTALSNIDFAVGDMHAMPMDEQRFDDVLLFNVLTYAEHPDRVLSEAFRVLRPGGRVVVTTLDEHRHTDISSAYQHVNAGFAPQRLASLIGDAGFDVDICTVSSRERRKPYFRVVTAYGRRPAETRSDDATTSGHQSARSLRSGAKGHQSARSLRSGAKRAS